MIDYPSNPGLLRIPWYILLHCTEVLSFNCGLSFAKYRHQLSTVKNMNISIGPNSLVDQTLPKIKSNLARS